MIWVSVRVRDRASVTVRFMVSKVLVYKQHYPNP